MTGGDLPVWLELESVSQTFGYELLESVLNAHWQLFLEVAIQSSIKLIS